MIHRSEVSMIAEARDAQWTVDRFLGAGSQLAIAPAKVNLALEVGPRGADGYHPVTTVLHALALNDRLFCHRAPWDGDSEALRDDIRSGATLADGAHATRSALAGPADNLLITIDVVDRVNPEPLATPARENLICRAFDALARVLDHEGRERIDVRLEKFIPAQAGLGGGSSDGAAALAVAARWWGLAVDDERVVAAANAIGSDVAFFLRGGCGCYAGRGGDFVRALEPASTTVVLVKPPEGVSTARAYAAFDEASNARGGNGVRPTNARGINDDAETTECGIARESGGSGDGSFGDSAPVHASFDIVSRIDDATSARMLPLFNNLESAACSVCEPLCEVRCWLASQPGVLDALVSGSGSATFALMADLDAANAVVAAASARGWWSRVTSLAPWGVVVKDA